MDELALALWSSQHVATNVGRLAAALWSPTDGYSAPCNDAQRAHLSEYSNCGSTNTYILLGFKDADDAGYYRHKDDKYKDRDGQPLVWKVHFKPGEKLGGGQGKIKNGLKSKKQKLQPRPAPSTGPSVAKLPKWTPQYTGPPLRTASFFTGASTDISAAAVASTTISSGPHGPSRAIAPVVSVSDAAVQCDILPSVADLTVAAAKVAQCALLGTDKTRKLKCFTCGGPAKTGGSTNMKNGLGSRSRRECLNPSCGDVYTHNNPKQLHENLVKWQKQNPSISFDDVPEEIKEKALEVMKASKRRNPYMCQTPGCNLPKKDCTHGKLKKFKAASLE